MYLFNVYYNDIIKLFDKINTNYFLIKFGHELFCIT